MLLLLPQMQRCNRICCCRHYGCAANSSQCSYWVCPESSLLLFAMLHTEYKHLYTLLMIGAGSCLERERKNAAIAPILDTAALMCCCCCCCCSRKIPHVAEPLIAKGRDGCGRVWRRPVTH